VIILLEKGYEFQVLCAGIGTTHEADVKLKKYALVDR
jgi:hypothetical protein